MLPSGSTLNGRVCEPTAPSAIGPAAAPSSTFVLVAGSGPSKERTSIEHGLVSSAAIVGRTSNRASVAATTPAAITRLITLPHSRVELLTRHRLHNSKRCAPRTVSFRAMGPSQRAAAGSIERSEAGAQTTD